jgi:hypothetical protein
MLTRTVSSCSVPLTCYSHRVYSLQFSSAPPALPYRTSSRAFPDQLFLFPSQVMQLLPIPKPFSRRARRTGHRELSRRVSFCPPNRGIHHLFSHLVSSSLAHAQVLHAHNTPPSAFHCFKYSFPSIGVPDSWCSQVSATFSMRFATKGVN